MVIAFGQVVADRHLPLSSRRFLRGLRGLFFRVSDRLIQFLGGIEIVSSMF